MWFLGLGILAALVLLALSFFVRERANHHDRLPDTPERRRMVIQADREQRAALGF